MPDTKTCFVIGPMGTIGGVNFAARLGRLARDVQAILDDLAPGEFEAKPPDKIGHGSIIDNVIQYLDRSSIVVADLTNHNPNVMYELAIRHALGRPCVMLRDRAVHKTKGTTPFDISGYRFIAYDYAKRAELKSELRSALDAELRRIQADEPLDEHANPIVKYFGGPLSEVSAGTGLAYGYYSNFVKPLADAVADRRVRRAQLKPPPARPVKDPHVWLFIPPNLDHASRDDVDALLDKLGRIEIPPKRAGKRGRPIYARYFQPGGTDHRLVIIDIPTTMLAIEESVRHRTGETHPDRTRPDWLFLEKEEFQRFRRWLTYLCNSDNECRHHVSIEYDFGVLSRRMSEGDWTVP
jgi:hypothetical protein